MNSNENNHQVEPFLTDNVTAPAFWNVDILWQVKATG